MTFQQLIAGIPVERRLGPESDFEVAGIVVDSREAAPGKVFVAQKGALTDGHKFVRAAIEKGVGAVIVEDEAALKEAGERVPAVLVDDTAAALSRLANIFFDDPYTKVVPVGITGTNGKTTISYLIQSVAGAAGHACGVIGTIGVSMGGTTHPLKNTTPGVLELHAIFRDMVEARQEYVAMEVSSHALDQDRVAGLMFRAAVFTNLTQDHLDYHKTLEGYFTAKRRLFSRFVDREAALIINADDPYGERLIEEFRAGHILSYGFSQRARIRGLDEQLGWEGGRMTVLTPQGSVKIETPLVGRHNLSNILAAVAFGVSQGFKTSDIQEGVRRLSGVPGRLERVPAGKAGFSVFVDYAHTHDALKNVLESLRRIPHNGKIITVFGCGGDRDRGKRPKMGRVASSLSDRCWITSDNPRSEDPQTIIGEVLQGADPARVSVEPDRAQAIRCALQEARPGDVVLIAGKGHETAQIIKDRVLPFDDRVVAGKFLKESGYV